MSKVGWVGDAWCLGLLLFLTGAPAHAAAPPVVSADLASGMSGYPPARKTDTADVFHSVVVPDPYRWMEDLRSTELAAYIGAQNAISTPLLRQAPGFAAALARLQGLNDLYPTRAPGREVAGHTFFRELVGNQDLLMVQTPDDASPRFLVDARQLGEGISIRAFEPSPDGRHVAYVTRDGGADWGEIRIVEVTAARHLPVVLPHVRFGGPVAWTADGSGVLYRRFAPPQDGRLEAPAEDPAIYLHRLGTTPERDLRLYAPPAERRDWSLAFGLPGDRRRLFIYMERGPWGDGNLGGARAQVHMLSLEADGKAKAGATPRVLTESDAAYRVLHVDDGRALLFTDKDAPRRRVVSMEIDRPQSARWRQVVPEGKGVIRHAEWLGGRLIVHLMDDVTSVLKVFDAAGNLLSNISLPGKGVVQALFGSTDSPRFSILYSGLLQAPVVLEHDLEAGTTAVGSAGSGAPDMSDFEVRQEWFTSRDGARIPMFVVSRRGLRRDGHAPTILYGYGASNNSELPYFREDVAAWLQMGGAYAIANIRGGGEFGTAWYRAAVRERKQVSFDDFIAAAEHLVATGLTSPRRLAIAGASNGGLLVTATMLQRPDLFDAVLAHVPVTDAMRRHLSGNGAQQIEQWGTPDDSVVFPALRAYSPVHNVAPKRCYPATLVTTALDDQRVPPWHAYKFSAEMQAAQACDKPVLLHVRDSGGHGGGVGNDWMDTAALQLAFAADQLGLDVSPLPTDSTK